MISTTADLRVTLDTNVLIYAVDLDADEKRSTALELLANVARYDGILTLQALAEFYHATTRKDLLRSEDAENFIDDWRAVFTIVAANEATLASAIEATRADKFSFWDAMICATAEQAGCAYILSEDMQHGRKLGSLEIVNPFHPDGQGVIDRLLA